VLWANLPRRYGAAVVAAVSVAALWGSSAAVAAPTTTTLTPFADDGIVSITPDVSHAKIGDTILFTIVAETYGPDPAEINVNTLAATSGLTSAGNLDGYSISCGEPNGTVPRPSSGGTTGQRARPLFPRLGRPSPTPCRCR